ncbi:MAG: hypothetical protein JSS02_20075 [Planctomycetes bacterium]|nr:hypothetical protein [Planctomycetota bacterium]
MNRDEHDLYHRSGINGLVSFTVNVTMAKQGKRPVPRIVQTVSPKVLADALNKRTKAELIQLIVAIAKSDIRVARELETELTLTPPHDVLVARVSAAIERATDVDEDLMNSNFDFDEQAYDEVRKGLADLIQQGQLDQAKKLALKLMKQGSYQVECSDEGLMTAELDQCLQPVIQAVRKAGGVQADRWAGEMQMADRVGFICSTELAQLRRPS